MDKNHKIIFQIITWIFVSFLLIVVLTLFYAALSLYPIGKDFVAYWASSRLLIEGHNPYYPDFYLYTAEVCRLGWRKAFGDVQLTEDARIYSSFFLGELHPG